ncbi:Sua5/YciO/YrdC/YwlC family protein [Streptomyces sp. NPDC051561]|uniref:Sua5/YciO/YrdC/YwlC family protein n=1 Tax=Streptomyces sp. NPDC051561 TaxID=3365658 RepID=UPI003799D35D
MDFLTRDHLSVAAEHLRAGRMLALPTSRWYMLCARAADPAATAAVFHAKKRPVDKPLLLLLDSPDNAARHFQLSDDARRLTSRLWPGDLALHLPWRPGAERIASVGSPALVGCPDGLLGHLLALVGEPLAASVCSLSVPAATDNDHPALTAGQVAAFAQTTRAEITAVVDDGICPQGRHMTIVDCPAGHPARLHREGTVHRRAVEAALTERSDHVG